MKNIVTTFNHKPLWQNSGSQFMGQNALDQSDCKII